MITTTDSILWYNVGVYGEAGFAVPNPSNDYVSINDNIIDLVSLIGRNLFAVMRSEDTDLRTPPSINTLMRVHKLYVRTAQIISGRAVPPNELNFEKVHVSPSVEGFRVYPVPYFHVRSVFLRRWCMWIMQLLSECMQHTENRKSVEISTTFGGLVGGYMDRVYQSMAVELFGKSRDEVRVPGFRLTDEDFSSYDPTKFFTSTELVDTVAPSIYIFTEDQMEHIGNGILVADLPDNVRPYPGSGDMETALKGSDSGSSTSSTTSAGGNFPPSPGP